MSKRIFGIILIICVLTVSTLSVYSAEIYEDEEGYYNLTDLQILVPVEYINNINSVTEDIEKLDFVTETFIMTDLSDEDVFLQEYIHIIVYLDVQNESEFNSVMNELSEKEYVYFVAKDYLFMKNDCLYRHFIGNNSFFIQGAVKVMMNQSKVQKRQLSRCLTVRLRKRNLLSP